MGRMGPLFIEEFIVRKLLHAINHEKIISNCMRATHIVNGQMNEYIDSSHMMRSWSVCGPNGHRPLSKNYQLGLIKQRQRIDAPHHSRRAISRTKYVCAVRVRRPAFDTACTFVTFRLQPTEQINRKKHTTPSSPSCNSTVFAVPCIRSRCVSHLVIFDETECARVVSIEVHKMKHLRNARTLWIH